MAERLDERLGRTLPASEALLSEHAGTRLDRLGDGREAPRRLPEALGKIIEGPLIELRERLEELVKLLALAGGKALRQPFEVDQDGRRSVQGRLAPS